MKRVIITTLLSAAATFSFAGDFIQWTDTSLTALYGTGFEVDTPTGDTQQTLTIEHANGWVWGDFFWFNDFIYFDGEENGAENEWTYYGEIAPRLSLNKILGKDLSVLFIKDWLVAGCYEYGQNPKGEDFGLQNYLIGGGIDLEVPGFDFVQLNVYQRIPNHGEGETIQVTPVWKITVPVGDSSFICDGFIDWVVNSDGAYESNLHVCPQFKFDIGALFDMKDGKLLAGVEYDYWKNKYGIKNSDAFQTDQHAISGIVQYHF